MNENAKNATRVGVAQHKPCEGCGRPWGECGGGWLRFSDATTLEAAWRCDECDGKQPRRIGFKDDCTVMFDEHAFVTDGDNVSIYNLQILEDGDEHGGFLGCIGLSTLRKFVASQGAAPETREDPSR